MFWWVSWWWVGGVVGAVAAAAEVVRRRRWRALVMSCILFGLSSLVLLVDGWMDGWAGSCMRKCCDTRMGENKKLLIYIVCLRMSD